VRWHKLEWAPRLNRIATWVVALAYAVLVLLRGVAAIFLMLVAITGSWWLWLVLGGMALGAAGLHAAVFRKRLETTTHSLTELVWLFVVPLAIVAWGLAFANSLEGAAPENRWEALVVWALMAVQVVAALALLVRHRMRVWPAALLSGLSAWLASAANLVAMMSMQNLWI
jgi:hypothetical protein